jgi:DNA-binding NtrC family response regulator/tetratricopeptide (TPR) repeat protein
MALLTELLGESPAMTGLRAQVSRLLERQVEGARRRAPILILGETGSGKGLLATAIHGAGPRATAPFVDVNCAAIPDTLLEAELFGFERGAFTDARQAKAGLFQAAHRGTLFLDEVGLLPEGLQAKLLKVLEEQTVRRLGSTRSEVIDVWLIAATSEDLGAAVRTRRFREDLYHRLAVVTLELPPLRERGEDVLRLAEHFLRRACEDYSLPAKVLTSDARAALQTYMWPGNVRELANVIERVALLSDGTTVTAGTLALPTPRTRSGPAASGSDERRAVVEAEAEAERARVLEALRAVKWNISRAAARLGIPRTSLRYRMDVLGLGSGAPEGRARTTLAETQTAGAAELAVSSEPSPPPSLRWDPRRLTFLQTRLGARGAEPGAAELRRAMEMIVEKVRCFGGQIDALAATSLLAIFGLEPMEDVARHAASAALAIQKVAARTREQEPGWPVVTLAIHTAQVPVAHHPGGHTVDGDAKQAPLAALATLGQQAESGTVVVSASAAPFLARRFELTADVSPAEGPTYRLVGPAGPERGLAARFVGRESELGLLRQRLHQAETGQGQIVSIAGEPGIGKSRLLREFQRQVADGAAWMEGQSIAFGRTMAFHPLIDLVRRSFRIDEADPKAVIAEKIDLGVLQLGEDLRPVLPFLRYLLSVDPGDAAILQLHPQLRRAGIFDGLRRVLARTAEGRPLVVVWEDLHWADQASEEFVALLGGGLAGHRILMIETSRPEYRPPATNRAFHTRLGLTALSPDDSVAMASGLLSVASLPEALQRLLLRRAEGNPFFLEELLRSCQETGMIRREGTHLILAATLDEIALPDTIQDLIRVRIERLGAEPRQMLDVAAVVGREFLRRVVDRLADSPAASERALSELQALDLIRERTLFPELTYTFKHALTLEVAYEALRPDRRTNLHQAVGEALEALHAGRLEEHCEVLARHFSKAKEWGKALEYFLMAARKAAHAFAIREALALYDQALEAAEHVNRPEDGTVIEIHRAKSTLHFVVSEFDRARAEAEQVAALARQLQDRQREAKALSRVAWAAVWQRDLDGSVARAREAIDVAGPVGAEEVRARAYFTIGYVRAGAGALAEAREAIDQAIAAGRASQIPTYLSLSLSVAGLLKSWEGAYAEAAQLQAEGLQLARQRNQLVPLLFGFFYGGLTLSGQGEYERGLALFREGVALAERVGDEVIHHSRLLNCLGWLHFELGDLERAIELTRRSAEMVHRGRLDTSLRNAEITLGNIYLAQGDLTQAGDILDDVHRLWERSSANPWMRWRYSMRLFDSLGRLWLARGQPARARDFADRGLDLATSTRSRKNLVKGWRLRAEIAMARGEFDDAEIALREALGAAVAIGNPTQLWKTQLVRARLSTARQRPDEAGDAYRAARAVLDRVTAGLQDPALRTSLIQATDAGEVYARTGST